MSDPYQRAGVRFQGLKHQMQAQVDRVINEARAHCLAGEEGLTRVVKSEMAGLARTLREDADRIEKAMQEIAP